LEVLLRAVRELGNRRAFVFHRPSVVSVVTGPYDSYTRNGLYPGVSLQSGDHAVVRLSGVREDVHLDFDDRHAHFGHFPGERVPFRTEVLAIGTPGRVDEDHDHTSLVRTIEPTEISGLIDGYHTRVFYGFHDVYVMYATKISSEARIMVEPKYRSAN
jgi:hypothetical protein